MACLICGEARTCLGCRLGGRLAELVATDPAYRNRIALESRIADGTATDAELWALEHRTSGVLPPLDPWAYVTSAMLADDARALASAAPPDVDAVAAIPRSGLLPGSLIAYHLHLPLYTVSRQHGAVPAGHGHRLTPSADRPKHVLLIDDTAASGGEMRACAPIAAEAFGGAKVTRAVVYAHPQGQASVDLFARAYPGSHYLDWNWANSIHAAVCAYDFDGIFCEDCPIADDDDGPRYARFLRESKPLYLPRRSEVPLVVTARREKYRAETLAWLDRHGVRARELIMRDFEHDPNCDWNVEMGRWKASVFARTSLAYFAESDPTQARVIAADSDRPVICPAAGRVIDGRRGAMMEARGCGCGS